MPLLKPDVWYQAFPQKARLETGIQGHKRSDKEALLQKNEANNSKDCYISNASSIYSETKV